MTTSAPDSPVSHQPRRWHRLLLRSIIVLVSLIVLFYVEENWRSVREWDRMRAGLKARGEPLTVDELLPPVPDNENFFAAAFIQEKYRNPKPNWFQFKDDARLNDGLRSTQRKSGGYNLPDLLKWLRTKATWNLPAETGKTGADILTALSPADAGLAALREATSRPAAQLLAWQIAPDMASNAARFQLETAKLYHLRHAALLHDGRTAEAAIECLQAVRFANRFSTRPVTLMQVALANAVTGNTLTMLRYNSGRIPWDAAGLQQLEAELSSMDLSRRFPGILRGERVFVLNMVLPWPEGPMKADGMKLPPGARFLPSGWKHLWLATVCETLQARIDGVEKDGLLVEMARQRKIGWLPPQSFPFSRDEFLNYDRIIKPVLQCDASLHIARVALAMTRWRLTKGTLPGALEELREYFPSGIPNDPLTGEPLEYRPSPDGSFAVFPSGAEKSDPYADLTWKVPAPAAL